MLINQLLIKKPNLMSEKKVREFEVGDIYNEEIAALNKASRVNTLEGLSYAVIIEQ